MSRAGFPWCSCVEKKGRQRFLESSRNVTGMVGIGLTLRPNSPCQTMPEVGESHASRDMPKVGPFGPKIWMVSSFATLGSGFGHSPAPGFSSVKMMEWQASMMDHDSRDTKTLVKFSSL